MFEIAFRRVADAFEQPVGRICVIRGKLHDIGAIRLAIAPYGPAIPDCREFWLWLNFFRHCVDISLHRELETTMRMMVRFTIPIEKGNQTFKDGSLGQTIESIMKKLKPEAAYFGTITEGKRSGMLFFDLAEPSQVVEIAEPLFLNLNAAVEFVPVMNADDLQKGMAKSASKGKS